MSQWDLRATKSYVREGNPDSELWAAMLRVGSMQPIKAQRSETQVGWMDRRIAKRKAREWKRQHERERERCKVAHWWARGGRGKRHP